MWGQRRPNVVILECFSCRKVGRWERWEDVGLGNVIGSWLYLRVGDAEWVQNFIFFFFSFLMLVKAIKRQDGSTTGIACTFLGGLQLGSSNAEKWFDHQREKFFINNSVEALIPFREEHQGLYWKCMYFWGGIGRLQFWGKSGTISKKGNFLWNRKITCKEASWNLLKSCLSFGGGLEDSNEEKKTMGRQQKEEVL